MRWGFVACVSLVACGSVNKAKPDAAVDAKADATPDAETDIVLSSPMGPTTPLDNFLGSGAVTVHVHTMHPNTAANISFTGTLGKYTPAIVTMTTDSSGEGSASTTFLAGSGGGMETTTIVGATDGIESPPVTTMLTVLNDILGNPILFGGSGGFSPNYLLGVQIAVPTAGTLTEIGFVSQANGPNIKVGIYTDTGTQPGTLVAQVGPIAIHQGVNRVPTASVALAAGSYWYEAIYDTSGSIGADTTNITGTSPIAYISMPFANALPTTFPAPSTYTGEHFNYFIVVK